jgi:hypothetical protein
MQRLILLIVFSTFCNHLFCQKDVDIRSSSYILGKQFYVNRDYLNAYKYLLAYKFSNYDKLSRSENSAQFTSLNNAIVYCESQIKKGLAGSHEWKGDSWSESEIDTAKKKSNEPPPILPNNHF